MTLERATSRCWAEIDLDALKHNYEFARGILGTRAKLIAVLKANAYGCGAKRVGRALFEWGVRDFAVATLSEALKLRRALPDADILVMGLTGDSDIRAAALNNITLTLFSRARIEILRARAASIFVRSGVRVRVQVKLNTGLNRLGLNPIEDIDTICALAQDTNISLEGAFTHMALRDAESDARQFALFEGARAALKSKGVTLGAWHACDSIGMVRYPDKHYDAARVGAWLYGVCPYRYPTPEDDKLIMCVKARIAQIRYVPAGECVGYDDKHPLARPSRVATLSAGYVDGYPRLNSSGEVEICLKRARVLGLVCMDQMMVDVTDIPEAREGGTATLLGGSIGVDEYASWASLNRNEALSRIGQRVPRVYISGNKVTAIEYQ